MQYTSREVYEFISKHNNDPIVEWKTCTVSGQPFAIFQSDLDFYAKISPTFAGQRFQIPTPMLCPEERQRRRLIFRNERKLYKRKCDATGDMIISMYAPNNFHKIYDQKFRRSDKWDPMGYGQGFDFSKTFTAQFKKLLLEVPRCNLLNEYVQLENSHYVNLAGPSKDCYMITETDRCRDCYYGYAIFDSNSCVDCNNTNFSELCYESVDIKNSYKLFYCNSCYECKECLACYDCKNLSHCFGCRNQTGGQYMIYNQQYTKQEYETQLPALMRQNLKTLLSDIHRRALHKAMFGLNNNGHFAGDHVTNSENIVFGFDVDNCRDCKYTTIVHDSNDCMDYFSRGLNSSMIYEAQNSGFNLTNSAFVDFVRNNCDHVYYSDLCPINNAHLFGCVGLRNKSYCIFNKQYTKSEYEKTVANIITHMQETGEWGEFFHASLSPFGYNETVANEYFPITQGDASLKGYKRQTNNYDPIIPEGAKVIDWKIVEQEPQDEEQILKAIFVCEISGRPYRIIKQELEFYRKHNLPLPRKHPDIRHEERMKLRPGRTVYLRTCDKTGEEILSVYPPEYPSKVYSEQAYQQEIYS